MKSSHLSLVLFLLGFPVALTAQMNFPSGQLDPTRNMSSPQLVAQGHTALPEQYIWIAAPHSEARPRKITPVYFRAVFSVSTVPHQATLYVAGAEASAAYINGKLVDTVQDNPASPIRMSVFETDISGKLEDGQNVLALKITPFAGRDRRTVVKIVPRTAGVDAPALLISGPSWKAASNAPAGWQDVGFKDALWKPVQTFGAIESSLEFFQGNEDAGLYRWPGYLGLSSFLAHTTLPVESVDQVFVGRSSYDNLDTLTQPAAAGGGKDFTAGGFSQVTIRPDLAGLAWAKGAEPTPHGLLKVDLRQDHGLETAIDLPAEEEANVLIPIAHAGQKVLVNGKVVEDAKPAENGTRVAVILRQSGHYTLQAQ